MNLSKLFDESIEGLDGLEELSEYILIVFVLVLGFPLLLIGFIFFRLTERKKGVK